jgi:Transglutaminase-like superfamily
MIRAAPMARVDPVAALRRVLSSSRAELEFAAKAWIGAFPVELSLAALGLAPTLRWIEAASPARGPHRPSALSVEDGERAVGRAYRVHLLRGQCLPRALLQYLLHRRDGTEVHFIVGVRRSADEGAGSIDAHAWVEPAGAGRPAARSGDDFEPLLVRGPPS